MSEQTYAMIFSTRNIIVYGSFLIALLTSIVFLCRNALSRRAKLLWVLVFFASACRGLVYLHFGGNAQAPVLPTPVIWAFDVAYIAMVILFFLSLVWWVKKGRHILLPILALAITGIGYYNVLKLPEVHEQEIYFKNLPDELNGYRIVQLGDLHCCSIMAASRTRVIVERANALKPDFIAMTGDNVDGPIADRARELEPIFGLKAKDGIAWIRGNHEYFVDHWKWNDWYRAHGVNFMTNTCVFPRPCLAIGGVNDINVKKHALGWKYKPVLPDVRAAFASATNGEFRILLQHRPMQVSSTIRNHHINLMLTGHTHGGFFPIIREWIARNHEGYLRGLYRVGDGYLHVTPGLGPWPGLPVRFFDPSEISLIVLRKGELCDGNESRRAWQSRPTTWERIMSWYRSVSWATGLCAGGIQRIEWPVMGTIAAVQWRGDADSSAVVPKVRETFARVEKLLNAHDPSSELRRLASLPNDEVITHCDPLVRPCYKAAFNLYRETKGVFNPRFRGPKTIDLGAIAKGFAVDLAYAAITNLGFDVLIDLGGNLRACGNWRVGILDGEAFELADGYACATSGTYYRGNHIKDGRTGGEISNAVHSITVIHPSSAMLADGLSTTLFIMGRDKGDAFLRTHYPEAKSCWIFKE